VAVLCATARCRSTKCFAPWRKSMCEACPPKDELRRGLARRTLDGGAHLHLAPGRGQVPLPRHRFPSHVHARG
jgi:hypothetical protein